MGKWETKKFHEIADQYADIVKKAAEQYDVPEELIFAHLYRETGGRPYLINPKSGVAGIAQFMPGTAQYFGLKMCDAECGGLRHLRGSARADEYRRHGRRLQKVIDTYADSDPEKLKSIDERLDPEKAIPAAAHFMANNKKRCQSKDDLLGQDLLGCTITLYHGSNYSNLVQNSKVRGYVADVKNHMREYRTRAHGRR